MLRLLKNQLIEEFNEQKNMNGKVFIAGATGWAGSALSGCDFGSRNGIRW